MVVRFTTACITNNDVHSNPAHGEMYSIQHYMIHFVSDLRQVGGFLRVLPPVQHYMIHFVSDLRQVGGFLRVLPPVQHYMIHFVSDLRQVGGFLRVLPPTLYDTFC